MKTGEVTSVNISALSILSATKFDKNEPTTATAASLRDLKGDIRITKPGYLCFATNVATLQPIDLPKRKISFWWTLKTLFTKS